MKKILISLSAGVLMSAACVACDKTNDSVEDIKPVQASTSVISFFGEHSDNLSLGDKTPTCLLINSAEEFAKIVPPSTALPTIDFDKYTLVVGRYKISGGHIFQSQSVDTKATSMILNLVIEDTGKGLAVMSTEICWGLYPKLPQKPIEIKMTYLKK
jgi:hypothetical protein